jgi:hypothetical protein
MRNIFKNFLERLFQVLKEWREEFFSIPLALIIFGLSPYFLRWIDPTAGTYDAGIFQIIIFATVSLLLYNGLAWMGVKQVFPETFDYFQNGFKIDFKALEPWQKIKVSLFIWGLLLASFIILSRVL